jgi:hypothetical protein
MQRLCAVGSDICPCTGMWGISFPAVDKSFYSMQNSSVTKELLPCTTNISRILLPGTDNKSGFSVQLYVGKKGAPI